MIAQAETREGFGAASTHDPGSATGIVAATLAIGLVFVACLVGRAYAFDQAKAYAHAVSGLEVDIKWQTLTFQRAALADETILPIYGASELFSHQADPYRGTTFFQNEPTGYNLFAVGEDGMWDANFFQMFGVLAGDLRSKKLVITDTWEKFVFPHTIRPDPYLHHFSPEIAEAFVYDAPIPLALKRAGVRRMADFPQTMGKFPITRLGVETLATGTSLGTAAYFALYPIGRIDSYVAQLKDAYQTVRFILNNPKLSPTIRAQPKKIDWTTLVRQATDQSEAAARGNPFGFYDTTFDRITGNTGFATVWSAYCSRRSNRESELIPYPAYRVGPIQQAVAWSDLQLSLDILSYAGADPLVVSMPLPGLYYNYTEISRTFRQVFYDKFAEVTGRPDLYSVVMSDHDEDRFFLYDMNHFTARGWLFVDRAIDAFWHGEKKSEVGSVLSELDRVSPAQALPVPEGYCRYAAG